MPDHAFEIVTDSTCDLPVSDLEAKGVVVVPLYVMFGTETYRDQFELSSEEFYDKMIASPILPRSSQPSPEDFIAAYEGLIAKGAKAILSLHIAGALSGTVQSAGVAAGQVDAKVVAYDTKKVAMCHGLMVLEAMKMRDAGETLEATVAHLDEIRPYVRFLAVPDTLENLVRNGRLPQAVGAATALLDIKIQLSDDDEGNLVAAHKAKGTRRALRYCVRDVESHRPQGDSIVVSLLQARNRKGCEQLLSMVEEAGYEVDLVGTFDAGPVISTHGGIGLVAMGYLPASMAYQA